MKSKPFTIKQQTLFGSRAYQNFALGLFTFLAAYLVASLLAPVHNSSAETQEVNAHIMNTDAEISVTPGQETLTLNVGQPEATGTFLSGSDTLTVKSSASSGYQLYVSMNNNHTNGNRLYLNGDESSGFIAPNHDAANQTVVYPSTATLAKNTWGFTASADDNTNAVYGAVPLMGAEERIANREDATPTTGDSVPVYFAVNVDTNMVTGDYTGTVLYTIIAEADNADLGIPSINPQSGSYNDTVQISVPLHSTISATEDLGDITAKIGGQACTITNTVLGGATVNLTCTVPKLTVANTYNVEVYIQRYDSTYVAENAFVYNAPTLANITTMQEMTSDICKASSAKQKAELLDTRGYGNGGSDKTTKYGVVKALGNAGDDDSECWMTDNLNLYNYTISNQTSDFDSPDNYTVPAGITATTDWNTNNYTTKKVEVPHGLGDYATKDTNYYTATNPKVGVFYNWTVAVAKETTAGVTTAPGTSICPKGWTLPTNGDSGTPKSWAHLLANVAASPITTGTQLLANPDLGFTLYYGIWYFRDTSEYHQGSYGHFWSGTPSSETFAYFLNYANSDSDSVYPQYYSYKGSGLNIRCLAR